MYWRKKNLNYVGLRAESGIVLPEGPEVPGKKANGTN